MLKKHPDSIDVTKIYERTEMRGIKDHLNTLKNKYTKVCLMQKPFEGSTLREKGIKKS